MRFRMQLEYNSNQKMEEYGLMDAKKIVFLIALLSMSAVFLVSCQNAKESKKTEPKAEKTASAAVKVEKNADATQSPADSALKGKVVETMNSGGYTYALLDRNGVKTWVAIPETKIKVGEVVTFQPGAEILNFRSRTLNREFKRIIFSGGLLSPNAGANSTSMSMGMYSPHGGMTAPVTFTGDVHVKKATGPNAYTVAELYEKAASLDRKKVKVRGRVVKVLPNIMGKNWIHIQDGSGDPAKSTNDLVVTSQDLPSVGDVVTVSGTLYKDKDFGAGYKYRVIVEEANVVRK